MSAFNIMVIAGEPSGDIHGGSLCREILRQAPGTRLFGMGGAAMAAAGVELVERIDRIGVVGFWEVYRDFSRFRKIFNRLLGVLEERRPSAVVLIDYPGFNLRFAQRAHARGLKVIYYISPQVWAWGKKRVRRLEESVDKMVVIFEFEKNFYRSSSLNVEFVGHPLLDSPAVAPGREEARRILGVSGSPVISLLPGSRPGEVERHLPLLVETSEMIRDREPSAAFVLSLASAELEHAAARHLKNSPLKPVLVREMNQTALAGADLALIASGTATLEAALLGVPMIIIYRLAFFSWLIARALIRIPYIGLVNVVYGKKIVPEYVQFKARPRLIARQALELLSDSGLRESMVRRLNEVKQRLGTPGASARAARAVLSAISPSAGRSFGRGNA